MKKPADKSKHTPAPKHTLEEVLRSLQDLVRNELAEDDSEQARAATPPNKKPQAEKPVVPATSAQIDTAKTADPPGSVQAEFPLLASGATPAVIRAEQTAPADGGMPDLKKGPLPSAKPAAKKNPPEQTTIKWDDDIPTLKDDIPVLQDVVLPPAKPVKAAAKLKSAAGRRAHAIAVQVAVKLNAELQEAGHAPLAPAMIETLEHLLREALESAGDK